ncbi:MAG: glycine zipper 2TM domain-containing protein [Gammaproteobacteria bacterium]
MLRNVVRKTTALTAGLLCLAAAGLLAGCSSESTPQPATPPAAEVPTPAADARTAALAAREQELSRREAELAAKDQERETAEHEAQETARQQRETAAQVAAAKKAKLARARSAQAAPTSYSAAPVQPPAPAAPTPIWVPAGTQITVALASDLSSKTAQPGDAFEAHLVSDLVINDRRAATAGSRVTGTITDVISGSNAIGSTPMLGLRFDHLQLNDGERVAIDGELKELGNSEKGQDAAKIVGGAAVGAVLGHQVKQGSGAKIIGGLLGGAIGAVAAKKTGTEMVLVAGSTLTIALGQGFAVKNP